ncbi:MAG: penicillin-binding protein [Faecalicoccus sp.]|uniref:penicillin-binding protein n=1 Tax=unclassified Faecalicoccus TaxID=2643311 RepID=UPI0025D664C9|nr:penicillin-binding protein [Faecalicoccus sp.]MCI6380556.1 penicillin-binding protein [Erysipelotrichaceae bacterium]MDY4869885.1 penicillin-binding protein [Faecalicoccus sp.]
MAIKRKVRRKLDKRTQRLSVRRSNRQLYRMIQVMSIIGTLVIANVLFTMVTKTHIWSQESVLNSKISSSIVDTEVEAKRGTIYDRNHQVIAQEVDAWTIVAYLDESVVDENGDPDYVKDAEKTAEKLCKVLPDAKESNVEKILEKAMDQGLSQTELGTGTKRLDEETMEKIKDLDLPGIDFIETTNRYYPTTPYSSTMVGFAAYDEDEQKIVGKMGLEQTMNDLLAGEDGHVQYQQTVDGSILPGTTTVYKEAVDGDNVVLTLDSSLQSVVEKAMKETIENNRATSAWAVVMEVETGKILAWASYPTYDQNEHKEIPSYTDAVSSMVYEPGSVMKPFTYATAIDTGTFPYNTMYRAGSFEYGYDAANNKINRVSGVATGYPTIYDAQGNDYGTLTFEDGLALSSNVGICELLANYMNYDSLGKYLDRFGFFQETGIPYISEQTGTKNIDVPMDYLRTGFGQSSSITVLQLMQAYSAIFNDGVMVRPYVVDSIEDAKTGEVKKQYSTKAKGTPISKETANKVTEMMKHVLDEGMSGDRFAIDGVSMAAKTGTGEIYNVEQGKYDTVNYTSSVMAAAPAEDPKIMVYWGMIGPNYEAYSAKQFQDIMRAALIAYGVSSETKESDKTQAEEKWETYTMPNLVNHSVSYAGSKTENWKCQMVYIGGGSTILRQYPQAGSTISSQDRVFLLTDGNAITMPDMTGWTRKDITAFWELTGIQIQTDGYGVVTSQSVEPETPISADTAISVTME